MGGGGSRGPKSATRSWEDEPVSFPNVHIDRQVGAVVHYKLDTKAIRAREAVTSDYGRISEDHRGRFAGGTSSADLEKMAIVHWQSIMASARDKRSDNVHDVLGEEVIALGADRETWGGSWDGPTFGGTSRIELFMQKVENHDDDTHLEHILSTLLDTEGLRRSKDNKGYTKKVVGKLKARVLERAEQAALNEALNLASWHGEHLKVKELLQKGADVNAPSTGSQDKKMTPLIAASYGGHAEVVGALIGGGAEIETTDENGLAPLHAACLLGHVEVIKAILGAGAHVDKATPSGFTALMFAADHGHVEALRVLIASGARINQGDLDGETALMGASNNGQANSVGFLLAAGANAHIRSVKGNTAMKFAVNNKHHAVVELLQMWEGAALAGTGNAKRVAAQISS